jgi:hypothetical protein
VPFVQAGEAAREAMLVAGEASIKMVYMAEAGNLLAAADTVEIAARSAQLMCRIGKRSAGRLLDGATHNDMLGQRL